MPKNARTEGFRWLWTYLSRHKAIFLPSLVALLLTAGLSMVFPWMMKDFVGEPSDDLRMGKNVSLVLSKVDQDMQILIGVLALQAFIGFWRVQGFIRSGEAALNDLRKEIFDHLTKLPISYYHDQRSGTVSNRISADLAVVRETLLTTVPQACRQMVILILGLSYVFYSSWKLSLLMLSCIPFVVISLAIIGRKVKSYSQKAQDALADASSVVEEVTQSIAEVKAYGNEPFERNRYATALERFYKVTLSGAKTRAFFLSFIIFVMFGTISAVVWFGSRMLSQGLISQENFTGFILFSIFVGASLAAFPEIMAQISSMNGASERLRELLEEKIERQSGDTFPSCQGSISFDGVVFAYPTRPEHEVLRGITCQILPGQRIAIVGASGAGKSTIFALLQGFYQQNKGRILIDGTATDSVNLSDLRKHMAIVPQEVSLFGGTIAENILYGKTTASQEQVEAAARIANAHDFISSLPEGYQTTVGARGIKLSGGQRQRIAIARAVLANPRILLLDEATSALDAESERLVNEALERLLQGRTALVIAHRLSTVRNADRILVLHAGQIVESGTHNELMDMRGTYRMLVETQLT